MATPHNEAERGQIAESILLPGDPLRARFIAEHFLEGAECFNTVRNMLGYTGTYHGTRISVMGTGMGCPSIGIYSYELIHEYGVKNLIRVGSCGGIQKDLKVGELVMAMGASTDGAYGHQYDLPGTYSAIGSYELLEQAVRAVRERNHSFRVGNVLSSDLFYTETPEWQRWAKMGLLAIEMESYALYCNASRAGVRALGIFTVSDSIVNGEALSAKERETGFTDMMETALLTAAAMEE